MTATLDAPPPGPGAPGPPPPPATRSDLPAARAPRRHGHNPPHLALAELALAAVSLAVVYGFARLFRGWEFLGSLLAVGAYTHLVTLVTRRRGWGVAASGLVAVAGFALLSCWLWFFDSTRSGIPTLDTIDAIRLSVDTSWSSFRDLQAPVPAETGLLLAAGLALFFAIFLADWAAFRLWSPIEALVPATTLFIFGAILGTDQHRTGVAIAFSAAVLAFVLAHRVVRFELGDGWIATHASAGGTWLLRTGAIIAVVALGAGALLAPTLPGAGSDPVIDWRNGNQGSSPRVTLSPLVDIRQRLVNQRDIEVFTVRSPQPEYWRMTALDTFDGSIWRSSGQYEQAGRKLPAEIPDGVSGGTITQQFTITGLSAIWLPAAYQPIALNAGSADIRYQASSSTLIVDTDYPSSNDLTYVVESEVVEIPDTLMASPTEELSGDLRDLTGLPSDFSSRAAELARSVADQASATTPYAKARALQDFFQDKGPFADDGYDWTYNLDAVSSGHDLSAIDAFIDSQEGYCEQYAGTYAAMARVLGLPSRVAVGFTWGQSSPDDPDLYRVTGRNAHAWPEVWLGEDVGWVSFEPTPERGEPGQEARTGLPPAQASGSGATPPTSVPSTTPSGPATTPSTSATSPTTRPTEDQLALALADDSSTGSGPLLLALGLLLMVVLAVIVFGGVPVAQSQRRHRRRAAAVTPDQRVQVAWQQLVEDLELLGVFRLPSETHREFATRASSVMGERGDDIGLLARSSETAAFAPTHIDDDTAGRAEDTALDIAETVHATVPRWRRLLHRIDPRTLRRR